MVTKQMILVLPTSISLRWRSATQQPGVGRPTAESALRELRADKLFLNVSGISQEFGLSHTNISEVTIKQAMIHSAREVILLADYTIFEQESVAQVAGLSSIHRLITDESVPAKSLLEMAKLGIKVSPASL